MIRYARRSDYGERVAPDADTKVYQRAFLREHLPRFAGVQARVLELGANVAFEQLLALDAAERWIADPYDGVAGGGAAGVPPHPDGIRIARCAVGVDSDLLPSDYFDLVFSSSVLEHVGQNDVGCDPFPDRRPPSAQEVPRRRLCLELLRVTKPGGVHLHTIDHAARNLTYLRNFLDAGFLLLEQEAPPSVQELLWNEDAVRQTRCWQDRSRPEPHPELHAVLLLGLRKPLQPSVLRRLPRPPTAISRLYGRLRGTARVLVLSRLARRPGHY